MSAHTNILYGYGEKVIVENKILYSLGTCPYCKTKLFTYNQNQLKWLYGSPIRPCKKCKRNFIDIRYHEIAIEGIELGTFSIKKAIKSALILAAISFISYLLLYYERHYQEYYHPQFYAIIIVSAIGALFMIFDAIKIITGIKKKKIEKLQNESITRLKDKSYAQQLAGLGYPVPNEYL